MVHRGPDAEALWQTRGLMLGHRRLKILDLSDAANQPFTDGRDALTFNGEIFNYLALREELSAHYPFKTTSDTEVLFRALQHWGEKALDRLDGQFAFAFYRVSSNTLLLARDHVGICPLYLWETVDSLYFASEIKPLLTLGTSGLDAQGVVDYFTYRYNIQNGRTLFDGIRRFPPAHALTIDLATGARTEKRYWRLTFNERRRPSAEIQAEFNGLMDREIIAQKMGDVPVGMYLSGGIDSGALLHGFARETQEIQSYTLRFSREDSDYARVLELTKRHHFQTNLIDFSASDMNDLDDVVRSLEEPFGDLIIAANYALAKNASSRVRVVLSGEGGDEAFCGYDHQRSFMKLLGLSANPFFRFATRAALSLMPVRLVAVANSYPGNFGDHELARIKTVFRSMADPAQSYIDLVSLFDRQELSTLLSDELKKNAPAVPDTGPIREIFTSEPSVWRAVMRAEIEQLTLIVNLLKQDRFSMRFSLEGRVPFVSRRILDFAATLPKEEIFFRTNKQYLLGYSGAGVIRKKPFSLFSGDFYLKVLIGLMDRYLTEGNVRDSGVLSWDGVRQLRARAGQGGILAVKQAMAVLVFILWWKNFRTSLKGGSIHV